MLKKFIPVYQPWITDKEKDYVRRAIDSGWVSSRGEFVERFELALSRYLNVKHVVLTNTGTAACHLAAIAAGIDAHSCVIVPNLTFVATVNSVGYEWATPVISDIDFETWNLSPHLIELALEEAPWSKAVIPVHLYGNICDMDGINKLAKEHGFAVIEDACEAFGKFLFDGSAVGTLGDIGCFSFFGNKTITTGEGGALVTDNDEYAEKARLFKGQGQIVGKTYQHSVMGYNYRMTNLQAALGLAQLERIDEILDRKKKIYRRYVDELYDVVRHQYIGQDGHAYWMYSCILPGCMNRDEVIFQLRNVGIDSRPVFYPIHTMPMYPRGEELYPNSTLVAKYGITLPSYPQLTDMEQDYIISEFRKILNA